MSKKMNKGKKVIVTDDSEYFMRELKNIKPTVRDTASRWRWTKNAEGVMEYYYITKPANDTRTSIVKE